MAFNRPWVADAKEEVGKAITLFILEAKSEASGQVCVLGVSLNRFLNASF